VAILPEEKVTSFPFSFSRAPLSHAAIVARELGILAMAGCNDATMRLQTGDRVRVDGVAGTVEILE
jgi:pyruvate,water dikinase